MMNDPATVIGNESAVRGPAAGGIAARLYALAGGPAGLAMVDQAAVSGVSFLATVLIGRFASAEHLGLYSLGISIVLALLAVQMSLLTTPYAVHQHRDEVISRTYAGSTLIMQLLMMALVLMGLAIACAFVEQPLRMVMAALLVATPTLLLREFARRMAYARLSVPAALAVDLPVVVVQITLLGLLAGAGRLTASSAFIALGAAGAVGAGIGLIAMRRHVMFDRAALAGDLRRSWSFGRWIAGAQLLGVVNTQGIFWLVAIVLGTAETGIYAACLAIVLLCNPFMLAVGNILTPRAAQTLAHHGQPALRRLILRASVMLGVVMALFCVVLLLWGDQLVQLLYGSGFSGHGMVITLLGVTFLVGAVGMAFNDGIRAMGRADVEFAATLLDSIITIGLGVVGLLMFGLVGLAWANLLGGIAALALQANAFIRLSRTAPRAQESA